MLVSLYKYQIDCETVYIVPTNRNFDIRMKEYEKSDTGLAQHCIDNCRSPNWKNFKFVHYSEKSEKNENVFNDHIHFSYSLLLIIVYGIK